MSARLSVCPSILEKLTLPIFYIPEDLEFYIPGTKLGRKIYFSGFVAGIKFSGRVIRMDLVPMQNPKEWKKAFLSDAFLSGPWYKIIKITLNQL